jgi:hypothetical protein
MMRWWTLVLLVGCGSQVTSEAEAELAYRGLDEAVSRALKLGLKGFSEATSANLDTQSDAGAVSGTMTVNGQADQGASDNKGLRLDVGLVDYSDHTEVDSDLDGDPDRTWSITYDTADGAPLTVDLQLRDIPDGTLTGTVTGGVELSGDLDGPATLELSLSGDIEVDPDIEGGTRRVVGSTEVTGTVTGSLGGVYTVDTTL